VLLPESGQHDDKRGEVGVLKRIAENEPEKVNVLSTSGKR
jgi:hypothetical protein